MFVHNFNRLNLTIIRPNLIYQNYEKITNFSLRFHLSINPYVVDSNLDWGQDLKRLSQWVNEKGIDKIYLDYSGGYDKRYYSAEKYYLKEKFAPWWGTRSPEELPKGSYLAVSAFFLQRGRGTPIPDFDQPSGYYNWLNNYEPIARAGKSIFIYYIQ